MSADLKIRTALPQDLNYLSDTIKDLVEHTRLTSRDIYFLGLDEDYEAGFDEFVTGFMQDGSSLCLIAEVDNSPIGSLIARETVPFLPFSQIKRSGEIVMCWVNPGYRYRGVAGSLVSAAEDWFRARGIEHVELSVIVGNTEAEAVWERLGYKPFRINSRKTLD